jgi:hypothetical protein
VSESGLIDRCLRLARVDLALPHGHPSTGRVLMATTVAIAGSLLCDAVVVAIGQAVFPSTKGYQHFAFSDYAKLTVIGVVIACAAWPVVTRATSAPRWLFSRLAVLVTLVLLLPDVWLLMRHQPSKAVAVLVVMHLAVAVVTYASLVILAPERRALDALRRE